MTHQTKTDPYNQGFNAFLEHGHDAINPYADEKTLAHTRLGDGYQAALTELCDEASASSVP